MQINYKKRRKELGLTQIDMALSIKVSLLTYQLWERGVTTPRPQNLKKLLKVLQIKEA